MKLTYNVDAKPREIGYGKLLVFALQQMLAILAATIAVPAIIGNDMSQSAALFGAGVGTLVYLLFTKFRSPVFLGSSFAFIGSMFAAFGGAASMQLGYLGLLFGALFAGLVYVVIAVIVKFAGVKWINKIMPAVIIGPTVAIIGLSLAGNAVGDLQSGNFVTTLKAEDYQIVATDASLLQYNKDDKTYSIDPTASGYAAIDKDVDLTAPIPADKIHDEITVTAEENEETHELVFTLTRQDGSVYIALLCGLVTLAATIVCSVYAKKTLKTIPFIIGICAGYIVAAIFTGIGIAADVAALRIIDFSKFAHMQWVPDFTFLKAFKGFKELTGAYVGTIAVAYIPVAFVVFAEHLADHKNISSIIEKDLTEDPGLDKTLLGDGIGSIAGAFFGGCPNTTYGESIGCVAITQNASVITVTYAAFLSILVAFISPLVAFLDSIPPCVMGGVCMTLYGFIAVSGLKMLQPVDLNDNRNLFVASVILISGVGGLSLSFATSMGTITITTVACALILGIVTNLIVRKGATPAGEEPKPQQLIK